MEIRMVRNSKLPPQRGSAKNKDGRGSTHETAVDVDSGEDEVPDPARAQMRKILDNSHTEQRMVRTRRSQAATPQSPFTPGRDTISFKEKNNAVVARAVSSSTFYKQNKQASPSAISTSRKPLSSGPSQSVTRSHHHKGNADIDLDDRVPYRHSGSSNFSPPNAGRTHHAAPALNMLRSSYSRQVANLPVASSSSHAIHAPRPQRRSASPHNEAWPALTGNGENIARPRTRRSDSPTKPPHYEPFISLAGSSNTDNRQHRIFDAGLSVDRKGKGKDTTSRQSISAPKTSGTVDDIQDPDGPFSSELEADDISIVGYSKKLHSTGRQASLQAASKASPNIAKTIPTVSGLRRTRGMKDKNGNLAEVSPTKHNGTVPSSLSILDAPITRAWIAPCHRLICDSILIHNRSITLRSTPVVWWEIPFETVQAEICDLPDHPFVRLTVARLSHNQDRTFNEMIVPSSDGIPPLWTGELEVMVELSPQDRGSKAFRLLRALRSRPEKSPKHLDATACETLRMSCDAQLLVGGRFGQKPQSRRARALSEIHDTTEEYEGAPPPQRRRRESEPSTEPSDTELTVSKKGKAKERDPQQSLLKFPTRQSMPHTERRSTRQSGGDVDFVNRNKSRSADPEPTSAKIPNNVNKNELHFPYPLQGRADVNITYGDSQRLQEGEFLNDTLLEFGLRYVLDNLGAEVRAGIHLFNSFFYNKLADKSKKNKRTEDGWPAYDSVKKWTKGKDIFQKKFIVVPINESYHWYLAVIVNPKGMLRRKATLDIDVEPDRPPTRATASSSSPRKINPHHAGETSSKLGLDNQITDSDLDELQSEASSPHVQADQPEEHPLDVGNLSMISADPLDCIPRDGELDEEPLVVSDGVRAMSLADKSSNEDLDDDLCSISDSTPVGQGRPIISATLAAFQKQNENQGQQVQEIIDSETSSQVEKRQPTKPDLKILGSEDTWVLTFDSLGGSHRAVHAVLDAWLKYEARDKLQIEYELEDSTYSEGKVPLQPNFYDCGLYLIHYAKQLLLRPNEVLRFLEHPQPKLKSPDRLIYDKVMSETWRGQETGNLRNDWITVITHLASQYTNAREAQARNVGQEPAEPSQDESAEQIEVLDPTALGKPVEVDTTAHTAEEPPLPRQSKSQSPDRAMPGAYIASTLPISTIVANGSRVRQRDSRSTSVGSVNSQIVVGPLDGPESLTLPSTRRRPTSKSSDIDPDILASPPTVKDETLTGLAAEQADRDILTDMDEDKENVQQPIDTKLEAGPIILRDLHPVIYSTMPGDGQVVSPFSGMRNNAPGSAVARPMRDQALSPVPSPVGSSVSPRLSTLPPESQLESAPRQWKNPLYTGKTTTEEKQRLAQELVRQEQKAALAAETAHSELAVTNLQRQVEEQVEDEGEDQLSLQDRELGPGTPSEPEEAEQFEPDKPSSSPRTSRTTRNGKTFAKRGKLPITAATNGSGKRSHSDTPRHSVSNKKSRKNGDASWSGTMKRIGQSMDEAIEIDSD